MSERNYGDGSYKGDPGLSYTDNLNRYEDQMSQQRWQQQQQQYWEQQSQQPLSTYPVPGSVDGSSSSGCLFLIFIAILLGAFTAYKKSCSTQVEKRGFVSPTPVGPSTPRLRDIEGTWTFGWETENDLVATLQVKNGAGIFRATTVYVVEQTISTKPDQKGILGVGSNPTIQGFDVIAPGYSPDELLLQRHEGGSYKIWLRDNRNIRDWQPLQVDNYRIDNYDEESISGEWKLKAFKRDAFLQLQNGEGVYRQQSDFEVTQRMAAKATSEGIHLTGHDLVFSGTKIVPPHYASDQLLFKAASNQFRFDVFTRDNVNVKNWKPITVKSYQPQF